MQAPMNQPAQQSRPPSVNPNVAQPPMAGQHQPNGPESQLRQAPNLTQQAQKYPQPPSVSQQPMPQPMAQPMTQPMTQPMAQPPMPQHPMQQQPMQQQPMPQQSMPPQPMAQVPPMNANPMGAPPLPNQQFPPPGMNQAQTPFGANNQAFAGPKMPPMPQMPAMSPMQQYPPVQFLSMQNKLKR